MIQICEFGIGVAHSSDGGGQAIGGLIGLVIIVGALIARAFGLGKPDPNKW